jgi:hypothetical protein
MRDAELADLSAKIAKYERQLNAHTRKLRALSKGSRGEREGASSLQLPRRRIAQQQEGGAATAAMGTAETADLAAELDLGEDLLHLGRQPPPSSSSPSSPSSSSRKLDNPNTGEGFKTGTGVLGMNDEEEIKQAIGDTGGGGFMNILETTDAPLTDDNLDWLQNEVKLGEACLADKRAIVVFTHHQYMGFESPFYGTPAQLAALIPAGCTILWMEGHEHALEFFDKGAATLPSGLNKGPLSYARLIGNGGFPGYPQEDGPNKDQGCQPTFGGLSNMQYFDNRLYMNMPSGALQLKKKVLYNGWTTFTFEGSTMKAEYRTLACKGMDPQQAGVNGTQCGTGPETTLGKSTLMASEEWFSDATTGNIVLKSFDPSPLLSVPLPSDSSYCVKKNKGISKLLTPEGIALIVVCALAFCIGCTVFTVCCPCTQEPNSCIGKASAKLLAFIRPCMVTVAKCFCVGMACAACANCSLWCYKCCGGGSDEAEDGGASTVAKKVAKKEASAVAQKDVEHALSKEK